MDQVTVSEVCEKYELNANQFYAWQKQFFENGSKAFKPKTSDPAKRLLQTNVDRLEKKLSQKDEVIAEIEEEYVKLKKSLEKP